MKRVKRKVNAGLNVFYGALLVNRRTHDRKVMGSSPNSVNPEYDMYVEICSPSWVLNNIIVYVLLFKWCKINNSLNNKKRVKEICANVKLLPLTPIIDPAQLSSSSHSLTYWSRPLLHHFVQLDFEEFIGFEHATREHHAIVEIIHRAESSNKSYQ